MLLPHGRRLDERSRRCSVSKRPRGSTTRRGRAASLLDRGLCARGLAKGQLAVTRAKRVHLAKDLGASK